MGVEEESQKQTAVSPKDDQTKSPNTDKNEGVEVEAEPIETPISIPWTPLETTPPPIAAGENRPLPADQAQNTQTEPQDKIADNSAGLDQAKTPTQAPKIAPETGRRIPQFDSSIAAPVKNIRTFEGDIAKVLSHTKTSAASIAIAESMKREGEQRISSKSEDQKNITASKVPKTTFFLLLSGVLIVGGLISGYYLYSQSPLAPSPSSNVPVQPQTADSIIPTDSKVYIPTEGATWATVLKSIKTEIAKDQETGTIKEIVLTSTSDLGRIRIPAKDMLELMDIPVPDILRRSLNTAWMLGVYKAPSGEKSVFVISTNNFFQNAFAGMLQWERLMADDIKQYVRIPKISTTQAVASTTETVASTTQTASTTLASSTFQATSTRTASSTAPSASQTTYITLRGSFDDRIVGNKDVREFVTTDGGLLFLYSFISNDKLLIADRESTLIEILVRLEKQAFIR